jgi:hypothetical protein
LKWFSPSSILESRTAWPVVTLRSSAYLRPTCDSDRKAVDLVLGWESWERELFRFRFIQKPISSHEVRACLGEGGLSFRKRMPAIFVL